jgi:hypothetical protein
VYGIDSDHLMISHASREHMWQVIFDLAVAAAYVVMPVGCPLPASPIGQ